MRHVDDTVVLTFVMIKTSPDQFETQPFAKRFLFFDIVTYPQF